MSVGPCLISLRLFKIRFFSSFVLTLVTGISHALGFDFFMFLKIQFCSSFVITLITGISTTFMNRLYMLPLINWCCCFVLTVITRVADTLIVYLDSSNSSLFRREISQILTASPTVPLSELKISSYLTLVCLNCGHSFLRTEQFMRT